MDSSVRPEDAARPSGLFGAAPPAELDLEFVQALTSAVPVILYVYDCVERSVVWVNSPVAGQLGVSPDEARALGGGVDQLFVHPEDQAALDAKAERTAAALDGEVLEAEMRMRDPAGGWRWYQCRDAVFRRDAAGRPRWVVGIVQDIHERKLAEERVRAHREQLRSLASELVVTEERERRLLAADLHDGLGQTLNLALVRLSELARQVPGPPPPALTELRRLVAEADRAARSLTFQLSPPVLHDLGLVAAVQWLVEDLARVRGLELEARDDGLPKPLDERLSVTLFRAVRELLINVSKHADTPRARVDLWREGERLCVVVADAGRGFDPAQAEGAGFGLLSIRERLRHLGGSLEVRSAPGRGTRVQLEAPLLRTDPAAEDASRDPAALPGTAARPDLAR